MGEKRKQRNIWLKNVLTGMKNWNVVTKYFYNYNHTQTENDSMFEQTVKVPNKKTKPLNAAQGLLGFWAMTPMIRIM